jgi:6-phosphofructokinase 1
VARGEEKLEQTKKEIDDAGGTSWMYTADVADLASCDALVARVLKEHGTCHYLVNNAGRSIRRGVINSFDRFHDYERTMQLNYFGSLRLIMGFLPGMLAQKQGQIINISSIGVLSQAPRFSAYVASKAALDSFSACAASELVDKNIHFTTINMPLVRTPMIAPTKIYENLPTLSPEEAADLVVEAIVHKSVRIATRLGVFGAVCHAIAPKLTISQALDLLRAWLLPKQRTAIRQGNIVRIMTLEDAKKRGSLPVKVGYDPNDIPDNDEIVTQVIGLRRGWSSLINIIPEAGADNSEWIMPLTRLNTRAIDRTGGTVLHTSRINPAISRAQHIPAHLESEKGEADDRGRYDLTRAALRTLEWLELDCLVALGGDGTLTFARRLHQEGVPIIAIPKTMDNDVYGTDYCLGFSTAVTRSVMFINDLRTSAGSHERFLIVELFGRNSGETCLLAAYLAGVDRALIAEVPFDPDRVFEMLSVDKGENPSNYAVVAISEGARTTTGVRVESGPADAAGQRTLGGIGGFLAEHLERRGGDKVIYQRLAYLMRSGAPDSLDLIVAKNFGSLAADLLRRGDAGQMVSVTGGRYASVPILVTGEGQKRVDVPRFYDAEEYRPKVAEVMGMPMFLH